MPALAERIYFGLCRALGRLLRSARYSEVRVISRDGDPEVRKRRVVYAPLLVWFGEPLLRILNTGVRVLPQHEWEERERNVQQALRGDTIRLDADGSLVMPRLPGETLASVLDNPNLDAQAKRTAIERAGLALVRFHHLGFTHGDAMAENVLIDADGGVAHWFDFETVHDPARSIEWRRADDLRALLMTCVIRTRPEHRAEIVQHILDLYEDDAVTRELAASFASIWRRPLTFHLGQAGLSFQCFRETAYLVKQCVDVETSAP